MKHYALLLQLAWRLWKLQINGTWTAARSAVDAVMAKTDLQYAAHKEPHIKFCPSCGQIPDGDRRMDHARMLAIEHLHGKPYRRFELDAAISLHYLLKKS